MDQYDHEELPFGDFDDMPDFSTPAGGEGHKEEAIGKCPKCGGDIAYGKYGAFCHERCGMFLGKAMGRVLTRGEVKSLVNGERILLKDLSSKNGGHYDAYVKTEGIEEYAFTNKEGKEVTGFHYKFLVEFPERKQNEQ